MKGIESENTQSITAITVLVGIVAITILLTSWNSDILLRFIGGINPILAVLLGGVLGFILFRLVLYRQGFMIFTKKPIIASLKYSWLILLFTIVAIVVDLQITFPEDMNISFPTSLLFYPVIAFFVEMVFHILPLAILLFLMAQVFKNADHDIILLTSMFIVAMLEPTYQAVHMGTEPSGAIAVVWFNLFAFNVTQLWIFKKYGFVPMYALRLIYYLIWHIIWGHFRLDLLFN